MNTGNREIPQHQQIEFITERLSQEAGLFELQINQGSCEDAAKETLERIQIIIDTIKERLMF